MHVTVRESAEGESRQLKLMKYTSELRAESIVSRSCRKLPPLYQGREYVSILREGFADYIRRAKQGGTASHSSLYG
jgi:hypothetical protein